MVQVKAAKPIQNALYWCIYRKAFKIWETEEIWSTIFIPVISVNILEVIVIYRKNKPANYLSNSRSARLGFIRPQSQLGTFFAPSISSRLDHTNI